MAGCTVQRQLPTPIASTSATAARTVYVFPSPGSRVASPKTQISIRGVAPSKIGSTATLVRAYNSPKVPQATSQGSVQVLPGGDVLVGWGNQPYVTEFDASGHVVYQATLPKGDQSYRAYRFGWSAQPSSTPSAVAQPGGTDTVVQVSWNGATDVHSWRVVWGSASNALTSSTTAPSTGFQTTIRVGAAASYLEVQALDSAGAVLGTSALLSPSN